MTVSHPCVNARYFPESDNQIRVKRQGLALSELKIRAKKLLKRQQSEDVIGTYFSATLKKKHWTDKDTIQLKDCQNLMAIRCGFDDWHHATKVLSGREGKDVGTFFHTNACEAFINLWFADYSEALSALGDGKFLVPYKRQYVVVDPAYLHAIGISNTVIAECLSGHPNIAGNYGTELWDKIAEVVVRHKTTLA